MFTYRPNFVPTKIMIIGCGGTGSRLVPLLAQFVKTCAWVPDPEMILIDDDIVEEKNLFRQNFIAPDVGRPKAEVLANRYARAFNMNIDSMQMRIEGYQTFRSKTEVSNSKEAALVEVFNRYRNNSIVVLCVDSPQARRDILEVLLAFNVGAWGTTLLIDSGNENDFGQVSVSTMSVPSYNSSCYIKDLPNAIPGDIEITGIPMDTSYFTEMQATSTPSCADLDQTMAINTMMAVSMFGIIQNFYYAKPILFHRVNISLQHGNTPQYMNTDFIRQMASGTNGMYKNFYLGTFEVQTACNKFFKEVYQPFQEAIAKAEAAKKKAEEAAKLKEQQAEEHKLKAPVLSNMEGLQVSIAPAEGVEGLGVAIKTIVDVVAKRMEQVPPEHSYAADF